MDKWKINEKGGGWGQSLVKREAAAAAIELILLANQLAPSPSSRD
jgi:hypothetical protein